MTHLTRDQFNHAILTLDPFAIDCDLHRGLVAITRLMLLASEASR